MIGLLLVGVASAVTTGEDVFEDPLAEATDLEAVPEKELSAEFGGSSTKGNTQTTVVNTSLATGYKWGWNRVSFAGSASLGRSISDGDGDGTLSEEERAAGYQRSAQQFLGDLRYDRFVSERTSLYSLGGYLNDPFAGYDWRIHGQLGASRMLLRTNLSELVGEVGFDVAREDYVDGVDPNQATIPSARFFFGYTVTLAETIVLSEELEGFVNVTAPDDVRLLSTAGLTLEANKYMAVKATWTLTHDTVPVDGYLATDQTVALTLVATVFPD